MIRKPYKDLLSGEQIVIDGGRPDRVHGVGDPVNGMVTVNTDANRYGQYPADTLVDVIT